MPVVILGICLALWLMPVVKNAVYRVLAMIPVVIYLVNYLTVSYMDKIELKERVKKDFENYCCWEDYRAVGSLSNIRKIGESDNDLFIYPSCNMPY
jgi:hypothetical protein